jgi:DNA-binding transcriptional LysR family regulator
MNAVHFTRLDLNLLIVFRALMFHRNVTRASEALNLTQSAVSHALGRLRSHYGDALFVRLGSGMKPTARAVEISRHINEALDKIKSTFPAAFDPGSLQKEFRVGLVNFDALYLLPALMGKLASEAPMAKIAVEHLSAETLAKQLNGPNLDLAIGLVPVKQRSWSWVTLFVDKLCVIAAADHPGIGDTISRAKYQRASHVKIPSMSRFDAMIAKQGIKLQFALSVNDFLSALFVVARSEHVALVPENVARIYEKICHLKRLATPVPISPFVVDLVFHKRHAQDLAHAWLRDSIGVVAAELKRATDRSDAR